jgi:hypothetical protein
MILFIDKQDSNSPIIAMASNHNPESHQNHKVRNYLFYVIFDVVHIEESQLPIFQYRSEVVYSHKTP